MSLKIVGDGLKQLIKNLDDANKTSIEVGWFEANKYPNGEPVAGVAAVHEHGSPKQNIPPRPFMEPAKEKDGDKWLDTYGALFEKATISGSSLDDVYELVGSMIVIDIKQSIAAVNSPPLKPATIAQRARDGYNTTDILQASNQMIRTVTKVVNK